MTGYACPLIERDEYAISGEFLDIGCLLHSEVHKWTPSVRKQYRSDLQELVRELEQPAWAFWWPSHHDAKLRHFIISVGGVFSHVQSNSRGMVAEFFSFPLD